MKKLFSVFLFVLFVVLPSAYAQDSRQVTATGVATVTGDPAAARDKAIEDALRRAVEQVVGTIVESETAVENYQLLSDKIYSRSSGYVKNYNVLSEKREGNMLRVEVSAEVSSGDLSSDLGAIGLLQRRMKYPRVVVMIVEDNILNTNTFWNMYSVSNSQAEATVIARLKEKGFNVVDPNYMRKTVSGKEAREAFEGDYGVAGRFGKKLGADLVIVGRASSTRSANNIAGSDLLSVSTTINASAVKAGTGEIIAQGSAQGTAAHINEVAALQQALAKASDNLSDQLIDGILEAWKKESSGLRTLAVIVQDINPQELDKLKAGLSKLRGVADVMVRNFSSGTADIDIQARTDAQDLGEAIRKTSFAGFRLVLTESSLDRLEYRVVH
jgi:hypothetical protein